MEWQELKQQFKSLSEEERNVLLVISKNFRKPLNEWTTDDLEWGLVGCGHDMDNAIDMIINAKEYHRAKKAGEEYANIVATRSAYELELNNRKEIKNDGI